jgi:hypothetical protein
MKLKVLACEVLYRETCYQAAVSPHTCDLDFMPKGLHDLGVEKMRPRLQERIDAVEEGTYDALVLVYGLCNNGTIDLQARHTPLVIPRVHDCIGIFFGDRHRYREYFDAHPGTYYRTTGWLERNSSESANEQTVFQKLGLAMKYDELVEKYGEDNAQYIMDTMGDTTANYDRLAFIRMGIEGEDAFRAIAQQEAAEKGWTFDEIDGSMLLLRRLLRGEWGEDFLRVEPGQRVRATHDEKICRAD